MLGLLDEILRKPAEQPPAGYATIIRVVPDLFTGEMLNVGIAITANNGRRYVKVIQSPGRLECFYGEAADNLVELAQHAAEAFLAGEAPPSPNLAGTEPQPFFNLAPEDALNQFFRDQVTAAIPLRIPQEQHEPLKTEAMRTEVYKIIRLRSEHMQQDRIIPQSPQAIINTAKGPRTVHIPLQPENGAGGLESADYSAQSVRLHLMDALLNIECAAEAKNLKKLGLFIARPHRLPEKKAREIDNAIDYVVWRAPRNCRVEVETDLEKLSDEIMDWAERKVA